ncbi:hypothetical protein Taro_049304 [Colocasia esculenta]|uniref:Uncharacterized protein n=1 Tax=Colocasia esculenta TaxID=4460 RepID=A0A843XAH2_COLES|nr:hypothetical protein [Colocasia esculenta]
MVLPQAPQPGKMQHSCTNDRTTRANREDSPQETCQKPHARNCKPKKSRQAIPAPTLKAQDTKEKEQ